MVKTSTSAIPIGDRDRIHEELVGQLERRLGKPSSEGLGDHFLRAEVCVEGIDIISWLCSQKPASRGYWSDREVEFELAGFGKADVLTAYSLEDHAPLMKLLRHRINRADGAIRYFGGLRFMEGGVKDSIWDRFKSYRFILPRFEVTRRGDRTYFACNVGAQEDVEGIEAELGELVFESRDPPDAFPETIARHDCPVREEWIRIVQEALNQITSGELDKVVLARRTTLECAEKMNAARLLARLKAVTQHRFHFCFQPEAEIAFIGASPERLYRRDDLELKTEALAGTRSRGINAADDDRLRQELIISEKEQREHRWVVHGIESALSPLCHTVQSPERPDVLTLAFSRHLQTKFEARLNRSTRDEDLLDQLHPTPAVGGYPRDKALETIRHLEPFDRGWYAGPVGWLDRSGAQFAVGIRSALVEHNRVHLYSGAGLVAGADPEAEWDELENKIRDFIEVLGCP